MNFLIIGEYSAVSKNLKSGLNKLGHKVVIFSDGDGWKKIKQNIGDYTYNYHNYSLLSVPLKGSWRVMAFFKYFAFQQVLKKYRDYFDVVLIINYEFIRIAYSRPVPRFTIKNIDVVKKTDAPLFMMACGDDLAYLTEGKYFRYWPHDKTDLTNNKYFSAGYRRLFYEIYNKITAVTPCMYDYAESYRRFDGIDKYKIEKTIPLAFDVQNIEYGNEITDGVIRIFHGLSRDSFKGTDIITEALKIIKTRYPSNVEIIIEGRMPLEKYLQIIKKSNIIIDQCKSYSYGMNALYCMAYGKLVLSGNEVECLKEFDGVNIPVVNILPSVDDIIKKLEYFINHPHEIIDYGLRARKYVEEFHDSEVIAQKYIDLIEKYKKI